MSREINFRGRTLNGGQWVYGSLLQDDYGNSCIVEFVDHHEQWHDVEPNSVGQFTGLYDKNGKEIYEGDILDFNGLKIEVRFVRGVFALLCNGDLDKELCGDCRTDLFAKIIGNIHDNPGLLKGGEK